MPTVNLTDRDIGLISRVVETEVPGYLARVAPETYRQMVEAVTDTITNRVASPGFPDTVPGVLNQNRAFSKITGPARLDPYGSVEATPDANATVQGLVRQHLENRLVGEEAAIGEAVNYANPFYSDKSNLRSWIDPMIDAGAQRLGLGRAVHFHGTAPGATPSGEYDLAINGMSNASALANPAVPSEAPRWASAAPMDVARFDLEGVPSDLVGPSVTPAQGYGLLASTMSQTPSLGLSGASAYAPEDRMMAGPVASGIEGLRAGLLSQQEQNAAPSLANAYADLGASLDQAGVLGLSGGKMYNPASPTGELVDPQATAGIIGAVDDAPAIGSYVDPEVSVTGPVEGPQPVSVQGPATSTIQTAPSGPTPPADVGSFPAAPTTTGQTAKKVAGRVAGALLGGAALGPVGGLLGGLLGNELASGKGLFSRTGQPQSVGGLLSSMGSAINNIGQGSRQSYSVWGGGTPTGTQATATDGSRITSIGGGLIARTDPNGVTTTFNDRGNIVSSPVSTGGLFSGIGRDIADAFGGGGSSSGGGGVDTSGMSPGLW